MNRPHRNEDSLRHFKCNICLYFININSNTELPFVNKKRLKVIILSFRRVCRPKRNTKKANFSNYRYYFYWKQSFSFKSPRRVVFSKCTQSPDLASFHMQVVCVCFHCQSSRGSCTVLMESFWNYNELFQFKLNWMSLISQLCMDMDSVGEIKVSWFALFVKVQPVYNGILSFRQI